MTTNWFTSKLATSVAALAVTAVCANSAAAKDHHDNQGFNVIAVKTLDTTKTTALFLLKGQGNKQLLYVGSADGKLTIFDATHPSQLRQLSSWTRGDGGDTFRIEPINERFAVASDSKTSDDLTVVDPSNTPSEAIAKHLKSVDAYAIDGAKQVLYVVRNGELRVIRFDHPITRDAEIWEQSYEAR